MNNIESLKPTAVYSLRVVSAVTFMVFAGCSVERDADVEMAQVPGQQFVGVWEPMVDPRNVPSEADPVYTPATAVSIERQKELRAVGDITGDYSALCIPPSMPTMTAIGPQEILLDDKKMTWIIEATSGIRWIWLDGRDHPDPAEWRPTANGHSIGRWEDDVLVVDTVGFMDKAMVYMNLPGNVSIYPSSQMKVVERLRVVEDGQAMIGEREVHDPVSLVEPWKTTVRYERRDWEIGETICMENNQLDFYFDIDNVGFDVATIEVP